MSYYILIAMRLFDEYFFPLIGLFYVIMKIMVKYFIRNSLLLQYDFWEIFSWFGVDLAILNLSLSIGIKIDEVLKKKHNVVYGGVWWYIFLVAGIIIAALIYGYINKRRAKGGLNIWWHSCLGFLLSASWLIGFWVLLVIIEIAGK